MKKVLFSGLYLFIAQLLSMQNSFATSGSVDLTFENGDSYQFDAAVCRTDGYQVDNLMVKASVSARGQLNNKNVVLFIDQSHPVGTPTQLFEDLQIWSTDINTQDLIANHRNFLSRNLDTELKQWYQKEQVAIQNKYKVTNEMSAEEMIETTDKSSKALDDLEKQITAKQTKMVRSFGKTNVVESHTIRFDSGSAGLEMLTRGEQGIFASLLGAKFSVIATCSQ